MRTILPLVLCACTLAGGSGVRAQALGPFPEARPRLLAVSPVATPSQRHIDARTLSPAPAWRLGMPVKDIEEGQDARSQLLKRFGAIAPPMQALTAPWPAPAAATARAPLGFGVPTPNVDGINYTGAVPADPTGDVGPDHYVQAVNGASSELFAIYDKSNGALVAGPTAMTSLGTGVCANPGAGDPQVVYDTLANRWLLSFLAASATKTLCVFLSAGSDPVVTTWTQYAFVFPSFPDYPKLAVWDSAYGLGLNISTPAPTVSYTFATMDRNRMLAGQPATVLTFQSARIANNLNAFTPIAPIGLKGFNPPKPGAPLSFVANIDDELFYFGEPGVINLAFDQLAFYTVVPNFDTPAASQTTGPTLLNVGDFQFFSAVFPLQPNQVELPSFTGTPMHRVTYRNLGDSEAIVLAVGDVVDNGTLYTSPTLGRHPAPHWIELRRVGGPAQPWQVNHENRYWSSTGPDTEIVRFMPAINIDSAGNLAMAYTTMRADPAIHPSLRYTGRLAGDGPSAMTLAETTLVAGTQSQAAAQFRWGDYFDMSMDPDGCRFWFTGAYMDDGNWGTRIAAFKHDECGPPDYVLSSAANQFPVCSANGPTQIPTQTVQIGARNAFWQDVQLGFAPLPAGVSASVSPTSVRPSASAGVLLTVASGTASGLKAVSFTAVSGQLSHTLGFTLDVDAAATTAPAAASPPDAASNQSLVTRLTWNALPGARDYVVEASTSPSFATLAFGQIVSGTQYDSPVLTGNTTYYWRVRGRNLCGEGANSAVRSFTTLPSFCSVVNASIGNGGTVNHTITVPAIAGALNNLDVRFVANNATVSDLRVQLTRLSDNRVVRLLEPGCNAGASISTFFDDAAAAPACTGASLAVSVRPTDLLSSYDGGALSGDWRITVTDTVVGNPAGTFVLWCLNPQGLGAPPEAVFRSGFE